MTGGVAVATTTLPGEAARIDIVVDTNIWLDMLVFDDFRSRRLAALLHANSPRRLPSSGEVRAELADVVTRPQFRLDKARQSALLARYDEAVTGVPVAPDCGLACR